MWQIRGVLLWLVALSEAAIRHQSSPPLSLVLCCACCVTRAVYRASGARREKRIWTFGNMVKWSRCPILHLMEFEPRRVHVYFFFLFFSPFLVIVLCTKNPDTQTAQTSQEQCRVRAPTSWLQRYTRLPPASRAGSNTTRLP